MAHDVAAGPAGRGALLPGWRKPGSMAPRSLCNSLDHAFLTTRSANSAKPARVVMAPQGNLVDAVVGRLRTALRRSSTSRWV